MFAMAINGHRPCQWHTLFIFQDSHQSYDWHNACTASYDWHFFHGPNFLSSALSIELPAMFMFTIITTLSIYVKTRYCEIERNVTVCIYIDFTMIIYYVRVSIHLLSDQLH